MAIYGMMDGYHGDENECHGNCGMCDECELIYEIKCEEEFEQWHESDLYN